MLDTPAIVGFVGIFEKVEERIGRSAVFFMAAASTGLILSVTPWATDTTNAPATYLKPAMLTRVCGKMTLHIAGRSTSVYRKAISLCLTFTGSRKESAISDT